MAIQNITRYKLKDYSQSTSTPTKPHFVCFLSFSTLTSYTVSHRDCLNSNDREPINQTQKLQGRNLDITSVKINCALLISTIEEVLLLHSMVSSTW